VSRVDPVCEEGNPLFAGLWSDQERYGTLFISARRWSPSARLRAAAAQLKFAGTQALKSLMTGGRKRRRKPPAKKRAPARRRTRRPTRAGHSP
jgi:hypothetical protein